MFMSTKQKYTSNIQISFRRHRPDEMLSVQISAALPLRFNRTGSHTIQADPTPSPSKAPAFLSTIPMKLLL
jgi:hypothetical protein